MKTLHTHDLEIEKKFYKLMISSSKQCTSDDIKNFITNQNKQLYIKIAEGELEKLEDKKRLIFVDTVSHKNKVKMWSDSGYNEAIQEQIEKWNNILQELNK